MVPTFSRFGLPEPLGTPAAFFKRSAAGGVFVSKVGTISHAKIEEIAKLKMPDLNTTNLESAIKTIEGTARNMGLTVE